MTALERYMVGPSVAGGVPVRHDRAPDQATHLRALIEHPRPALRRVRTAKVLTISSGKGGVGKTNIAVNLAVALSLKGVRVTLLDLDLGLANADLLCGINPTNRLDHALDGASSLADLAIAAPGGFRLIPGSVGLGRMAELSPDQRSELLMRLGELDESSDLLILDTGAGVGPLVRACLRTADLAAVVATAEPTSIADAYALIKVMRQLSARPVVSGGSGGAQFSPALIINETRDSFEAQDVHARLAGAAKRFLGLELPMLGWLPLDIAVPHAVRARQPFSLAFPRCPAAQSIAETGRNISSRLNLAPQSARPEQTHDGFFSRLSRLVAGRVE